MADNNYIEITARLNMVKSGDEIQKQLNELAKKLSLQLDNVAINQNGLNALQASIDAVQKNLHLNIGSVNIDQSQIAKQAQQISQNLVSSMTPSVDLSGIKKAYSEISMIQEKLNAEKIDGFTSQSELSQYINNLLKGFKGITTSVTSLNEVNKAINGFKIEVQNADRVTESLAFHIKDIKGAGSQWALSSFKSSDNSIRNMESDARKLNTEFKTLTHYWQMMENLSERSILGKNKDSAEVQNLQAQISWLDKAYNIFKKHFETAPQNPRLTRYVSELQQAIISANSDAHNLVRTLSEQQTSLNPEVELNNLKTLMNNLKASNVEVDKLKVDYGELVGLFTQARETGDWTQFLRQLDIFKSKFTEAKSEVRATNAEIADLEKMARNLSSNKMNNFFNANSGNIQANTLKTEIVGLVNEWTTLNQEIQNTGRITPSIQTRLDELRVKMQNATSAADNLQRNIKKITDSQKLATQRQSLDTRITSWLQNNTRASQETKQALIQVQQQIQNADRQKMTNLSNQFREITAHARAAGEAGMRLGDVIKQKLSKFAGWFSIATVVMRAVNELKNMYREVVELDTALVDLRKTTDGTNAELEQFYVEANKIGKNLGVTTKEVIEAASSWSRLGYSLKDAQEMAKTSSIFASISPNMNIEQATDGLVSTMKAYKIEASDALDAVASKVNIIGNTRAVSNADIVNFLTRSSAAMAEANSSLEETIALGTAITEITRDAQNAGQVMKTMSMRIRGIDEETEEYSDEVAELTGKIADLTKTAKHPMGISLFTDESKTTYKSTVQILREISQIYDEMTDKDQAKLLEVLGGKRNGQAVAAALNNFDAVEKSLETMQNSAGNAEQEMSVIMDSIEYKTNRLKETAVGIAQDIFQRDSTKQMVDSLTSLLEVINTLTKSIGGLGTAITGLMAYKGLRGQGIFDIFGVGKSSVNGIKNFFTQPILSQKGIDLGLTQDSVQRLSQYNNLIKQNVSITSAYHQTMRGADDATKLAARNIANGSVQMKELTTASKAAAIGMNLLNAAMNIGVSLAISAAITGVYKMVNAAREAYQTAEEAAGKAKQNAENAKAENQQIQDLIDKYKELKAAETSDNKQETRQKALELQEEITNIISRQSTIYDEQSKHIDLVNGQLEEQLGILNQISQTNFDSMLKSASNAYRTANTETQKYVYDSPGVNGKDLIRFNANMSENSNDSSGMAIIDELLNHKFIASSKRNAMYYQLDFAEDTTWKQRLQFLDQAIDALKSSAEFDTSQKGLYDELLQVREEISQVVRKEVDAATNYASLLVEDEARKKANDIQSYNDFVKARQEIIDDVYNDGDIKKAILDGVLSNTDVDKYIDEYLSTLNNVSDYYDEWVRRNTYSLENMSDAEKAWAAQTQANTHSIVNAYKSAYSEIKDIEEDKPQLTLFDVSEYTDSLKDVDKAISSFESAIKSIDNNEMPDAEFFGKFPELAQYADDLTLLRQKIFELMSSYPDEVIQELKTLKENIDLSKESLEEEFKLLSAGGTVNLGNRPVISTEELKKAGWSDVEGDVATVYTSGYSNGETGKKAIAINFTPIVVDENGNYIGVLSPDELEEYAQGVIAGTRTDDLHLQIGAKFTGKKAVEESEAAAENIHKLQEYYYVYNDKQRQQESRKQKKQIDGLITMLDRLGHKAKEVNGVLTNLSVDDYIKSEENHVQGIIDKLEAEKDAQNDILDNLKSQKEELEGIISDYEKTADVVGKFIDRTEIEPLNDRKSEIEDYYNAEIEKLKEENAERDRNIELQEKQDALANARKTKVRVFSETQGWHYENDIQAVQKAEKELSNLTNEISIEKLEKQRDSEIKDIEKEIKAWEEYKDEWKKQVESITEADEELIASKVLGSDWHEKIADKDIGVMDNFRAEYVTYNNKLKNQVNVEIANMERVISAREREIDKWKDYKTEISSLNNDITNSNAEYLKNLNQFVLDENSTWQDRINHLRRNKEIIAALNEQSTESNNNKSTQDALAGSNVYGIIKDDQVLETYVDKADALKARERLAREMIREQVGYGVIPEAMIEVMAKSFVKNLKIKKFARGGIASSTGLAWLDGTNTNHEVVFNSAQAKYLYDTVRSGDFGNLMANNILNGIKNNLSTLLGNKQAGGTANNEISISFPNAVINAKDYDTFKGFMDRYTTDLLLKMQVGL